MNIVKFFTILIFFLIYFILCGGRTLVLRNVKEINAVNKNIFSLFSNMDILSIISSLFGSSNTKEETNDRILMISSKLQSMISSLSSFFQNSIPSATSLWTQLSRVKHVENDVEFINVIMKEIEQLKNLLQIINNEEHIDLEITTEALPFSTYKILTTETINTTAFTKDISNSANQKNKWSVKLINRFRERINDFINQMMQIFNQRKICVECEREGQPISSSEDSSVKK